MTHNHTTDSLAGVDRRSFMKLSGGCAALSSVSLLSTVLNLKLTKSAVAAGHDLSGYKALVCVFLLGGYDSYNVLAPYEDTEHVDYLAARTDLGIPKAELLEISANNGRRFGIHEGMPEVRDLYNQGDLAFVANVGSLIEPVTLATYNQARKPLGLYSHSDLVKHWQTSIPQSRSQVTGWGGRMADMLTDTVNQHPTISMNISLGGLNTFETGQNVVPYVVSRNGATRLNGFGNTGTGVDGMYTRYTNDVLSANYGDLLEKSYANVRLSSIQAAVDFNTSTSAVNLGTVFPETRFADNLKMVARAIGARSSLQQTRQIFFVTLGGWDHHANLLQRQVDMLPGLSQALKAFYDATVELGVADDVVTFTASDFARTLSTNGSGSDHGWGGNQIVMGGPVSGSHVYADYPSSLAPGNNLDRGRGRLIPTTAVDEYNAELATWFGVENNSSLESVLPNIRNFYTSGNTAFPIGFLTPSAALQRSSPDLEDLGEDYSDEDDSMSEGSEDSDF